MCNFIKFAPLLPSNSNGSKRKLTQYSSYIKFIQGCHQSAWFEFPDFFGALFPDFPWPHDRDLMGITWNPERSEEKFCTCNHWVFTKICLEIRDKLWVISARSFSLTFPDSRQKILKFPDFPEGQNFPWFSLIFPDGGNPVIPSRISGRNYKIGPVCLCVCLLVSALTTGPFKLRTLNLAGTLPLIVSRMSSKVKVKGQGRYFERRDFRMFYGVTCVDWTESFCFDIHMMSRHDVTAWRPGIIWRH